ncbi:MAG: CvpA family protein [Elusimicrobiota bacterium]|nr:CvpA family protein [Elusimicrobiota bacterium]
MNFIDLIIFLSILFFAWVGSRIGILTTISSVLSGIFGSVAANLFYAKFAVFLPPKPSSLLISYFVIFFSVSVLIFYTGHAVSKLMHLIFFGLLDRFLGALTGILLGAVICGVLLMVAIVTPSAKIRYYVKNSTLAPFVINKIMAPAVKPFSRKRYEALTKDITVDVIKKIKSLPPPLR